MCVYIRHELQDSDKRTTALRLFTLEVLGLAVALKHSAHFTTLNDIALSVASQFVMEVTSIIENLEDAEKSTGLVIRRAEPIAYDEFQSAIVIYKNHIFGTIIENFDDILNSAKGITV